MAFEIIDNLKPAAGAAPLIPASGVKVGSRKISRPARAGGGGLSYIRIDIGAELAKGISLTAEQHRVRLLFGTGSDAGKLQVSVDDTAGNYQVKRSKSGSYFLTINAASAEGLFALEFPVFTVLRCEPVRPENGQPKHFVFTASAPMLAVPD